ncbi:hypothetical protein M3Y97_00760100 [Aphelenchoides bicaudatus]|nr:hypothetical protein M3Y97_00760100 [Aphelenchoides bicaudatus]
MLLLKSCFLLLVSFEFTSSAVFNRYQPMHGKFVSSKGIKIEKLASFGTTSKMQQTAVQLIRKYFHPRWFITGQDSEKISNVMEQRFGGNFFVGMFSGETDTAYTVVRRSPSYMLFRVADRVILIAKESPNPKLHNDSLL